MTTEKLQNFILNKLKNKEDEDEHTINIDNLEYIVIDEAHDISE